MLWALLIIAAAVAIFVFLKRLTLKILVKQIVRDDPRAKLSMATLDSTRKLMGMIPIFGGLINLVLPSSDEARRIAAEQMSTRE